jgi:hypothetical protein
MQSPTARKRASHGSAKRPSLELVVPFDITAAERVELHAAILSVTDEWWVQTPVRFESADVAAAFDTLSARIAANDRLGAERAIWAARSAVRRYREVEWGDAAPTVELEAMSLALEHAERLARDSARND